MTFCLQAGLMFRRGARTLELVRELPDGKLTLEDCVTRRPSLFEKSELLNQIWTGRLVVIEPINRNSKNAPPLPSSQTLAELKPAAKRELERREAYLEGLRKAHISKGMRLKVGKVINAVAARIGDEKKPSPSAVMEWARKVAAAGGYVGALVSRNAFRKSSARIPEEMEKLVLRKIQKVYLTRDQHSLVHTQTEIHREAARLVLAGQLRQEDAKISLATLSRRVAEIDKYRVIEARQGPARARMVCRTTMDGTVATYPLQRVEVDHTPLNWVVVCDRTGLPLGRPLLTVFIDAYSGYVLGFYVSFYGAGLTSVSGALRNAIRVKDDMTRELGLTHRWLAAGIPDHLILDNGLEFHSRAFQLMGWELGMSFTYCRVRTPWLKPHVERFFSTLDTITLGNGRVHKRVANVVSIDPNKGAAVMFSDFVRGIAQFVVDVHPFLINQRKLSRPYDVFAEGIERRPPVHFPSDMESLRQVSAISKELTVAQGGLVFYGLPYGGSELDVIRDRFGGPVKTLVKFDPDDLRHVWVRNPVTHEWLASNCRWASYARGLSYNQHLMIRAFARQELKKSGALEYLEQARLRLHEHWMESVVRKTRLDRKLAAVTAGYTSAQVLGETEISPTLDSSTSAQERVQAHITAPAVVPLCAEDFETVDLY
jgi:putative transposase